MSEFTYIDSTNFSYLLISDGKIMIFGTDGDKLRIISLKLNKYLKFMGKFAYSENYKADKNSIIKFNLGIELLAASDILRKDTQWKLRINNETEEISYISPVFESIQFGYYITKNKTDDVNVIQSTVELVKNKHKIKEATHAIAKDDHGEIKMNFVYFITESDYSFVFPADELIECDGDYLPIIQRLIVEGLYVNFDFVGISNTDGVKCHIKPTLSRKKLSIDEIRKSLYKTFNVTNNDEFVEKLCILSIDNKPIVIL